MKLWVQGLRPSKGLGRAVGGAAEAGAFALKAHPSTKDTGEAHGGIDNTGALIVRMGFL